MFAGKSTELIRRLRDAASSRQVIAAFKPLSDTRSGAASIRTHPGESLEAQPIAQAAELLNVLPEALDQTVVGIDEAHFFGASLWGAVCALLRRDARVIVAGVERDHRGLPFEPFPSLLCEADEVSKLTASCAVCGGAAVHTQRMVNRDDAIVVGGAESYQARCRRCFTPGT